jgi:hypothetical protein
MVCEADFAFAARSHSSCRSGRERSTRPGLMSADLRTIRSLQPRTGARRMRRCGHEDPLWVDPTVLVTILGRPVCGPSNAPSSANGCPPSSAARPAGASMTSPVRSPSVRVGRLGVALVILVVVAYRPDEVLDEAIPGVLYQLGGRHHFVGAGDLQLDRLIVVVSLPHDNRA